MAAIVFLILGCGCLTPNNIKLQCLKLAQILRKSQIDDYQHNAESSGRLVEELEDPLPLALRESVEALSNKDFDSMAGMIEAAFLDGAEIRTRSSDFIRSGYAL